LHVPSAKNDPQGYGSALTYARRYSLMAACGIAPEDDDGNAASKTPAKAAKPAEQDPRIADSAMHIIGLHKEQNDAGLKSYLASLGKDGALKSQVWAALPDEVKNHIQSLKGDK